MGVEFGCFSSFTQSCSGICSIILRFEEFKASTIFLCVARYSTILSGVIELIQSNERTALTAVSLCKTLTGRSSQEESTIFQSEMLYISALIIIKYTSN
jgi:hypothetical protein